jgi:hypothetical protein
VRANRVRRIPPGLLTALLPREIGRPDPRGNAKALGRHAGGFLLLRIRKEIETKFAQRLPAPRNTDCRFARGGNAEDMS